MTVPGRVGIVGGGGWLGGAIARAALAAGALSPDRLWLSSRSGEVRGFEDHPGITVTADNDALAEACETVILSVRPQDFDAIELARRDRLVISVMAGVSLARICAATGSKRVIRALPNAAAAIGRSFTPWHASEGVTAADRLLARALFASCGTEAEVPTEGQIDYFTALSGSGPAFPALLAAAMAEDAVAQGIDREVAEAAVRQTLLGGAELLAQDAASPEATVGVFIDYAGTTAAGLVAAQQAGFREAVAAGLQAAAAKARALGG